MASYTDSDSFIDTVTSEAVAVYAAEHAPIGTPQTPASLTETDTTLSSSGTISIADTGNGYQLDTVAGFVSSVDYTSGNYSPVWTDAEIAAAKEMLTITGSPASMISNTGTLNWSFNSGSQAFNEIPKGKTLTLTYSVALSDSLDPKSVSTYSLPITITGTSEKPYLNPTELADQIVQYGAASFVDNTTRTYFHSGDGDPATLLTTFAATQTNTAGVPETSLPAPFLVLSTNAGADAGKITITPTTSTFENYGTYTVSMTGSEDNLSVAGDFDIVLSPFASHELLVSTDSPDTLQANLLSESVVNHNATASYAHVLVAGTTHSSVTGVKVSLAVAGSQDTYHGIDTLKDVNSLIGSAFKDQLTGNGNANFLDGGSNGVDTLTGGAGDDTYVVHNSDSKVVENAGAGADTVLALDSYILPVNVEKLTLLKTAANATGNGSNNTLIGNASNNILTGGLGADAMTGNGGADTYYVDNTGDTVTEVKDDVIDLVSSSITLSLAVGSVSNGNVEYLTLTGTSAINGTGNALVNYIKGNDSSNILTSGAANPNGNYDTLNGGGGNDTFEVNVVQSKITLIGGNGTDLVNSSVAFSLADFGDVENLTLSGNGSATGNTLSNILTGSNVANNIDGGNGGGTVDTMIGAGGNDTYTVWHAADKVIEVSSGGTDDTINSNVTSFTLPDFVENLELIGSITTQGIGNGQDNYITGNNNDNTLIGGGGSDTMQGLAGDDVYYVDNVGDKVIEVITADSIDKVFSSVDYTLPSYVENLELIGTNDASGHLGNLNYETNTISDANDGTGNIMANQLIGNSAANTLNGRGGADSLNGGAGADTLIGGLGADILTGGSGADVFKYTIRAGTESGTNGNADTITDLTMGDKIDLSAIDAKLKTGVNDSFTWIGTGNFTGAGGELRYETVSGGFVLKADLHGGSSPVSEFEIKLTGSHAPVLADFIL